jgi:putative membrane protein
MAQALAAYLHYLSIFVLFALLSVEHVQFKLPLDLRRARSLIITDIAYGISAGVVLFTGLARALWYGKGLDYYLGNSLFHAKVGLFILVGLISVAPTFAFLNWRNSLKAGEVPQVSARQARLVIMVIRLELLLLLAIPLLAVLMARGYGVIG